jgi:hypothetical protein
MPGAGEAGHVADLGHEDRRGDRSHAVEDLDGSVASVAGFTVEVVESPLPDRDRYVGVKGQATS